MIVNVVRCGDCWKWCTDDCAVAWRDGEELWLGAGDHDDFCPYGEAI